MSRTYVGKRTPEGAVVEVWEGNSRQFLPSRLDLRNHSPDGFEWGYGGSGPAQLALAILAYELGSERATWLYQDYKWDVIAAITSDFWEIPSGEVATWMEARDGAR